jgi:antitoxin (DNA-binding transcriptional repressor) of toxin-antitoxin stability system
MHHMTRRASIRDLRYRFSEVERLLQRGEKIEITKHRRVIAHLVPVEPTAPTRRPDFLGRLRAAFGDKILKVSGAELLAQERERF